MPKTERLLDPVRACEYGWYTCADHWHAMHSPNVAIMVKVLPPEAFHGIKGA